MTRLTVLRSVGVAILSSVAALATITNTTTCSYDGMTVTEPSSCAGQHGSDGAFATATATVISGYNVSVSALASADVVNNDQADGGPTDFASASAGVTQQFYSKARLSKGSSLSLTNWNLMPMALAMDRMCSRSPMPITCTALLVP
jgi:hypothetical protein